MVKGNEAAKERLLRVIFIAKVVVAAVFGVVCGTVPVLGWAPIAGFMVLSYLVPYVVYNSVYQVDPEDYGGEIELLNEAQMPAMAAFGLAWILTYTSSAAGLAA